MDPHTDEIGYPRLFCLEGSRPHEMAYLLNIDGALNLDPVESPRFVNSEAYLGTPAVAGTWAVDTWPHHHYHRLTLSQPRFQ